MSLIYRLVYGILKLKKNCVKGNIFLSELNILRCFDVIYVSKVKNAFMSIP